MTSDPILLTDEQMRHFIAHGYLILNTDFPDSFHNAMNARIEAVMEQEGNPGNNILPRVPEVQEVFRHPVIRGAVGSVLGPDYLTQPHRHCHFTSPGRKVQSWHKDSYWGYARVRNHRQWWAMIFYYPQTVDTEMGPSGIIPGTQYYDKRPGDETEQPLFLEGRAGTFALIHYDLWHRGGANMSNRNRAMLKFQFTRMTRPAEPTWDNRTDEWQGLNGDGPPHTHETLWRDHWNWLSGRPGATGNGPASDREPTELADLVAGDYEPDGVGAAYELAHCGHDGIRHLRELLASKSTAVSRRAGYGLSTAGPEALAAIHAGIGHESALARRHALFAAGEQGAAAADIAPNIAACVQDGDRWVRRTAVEALGMLEDASATVPVLIPALQDDDDQVRYSAALSLGRYRADAAEAIDPLMTTLQDENRYVRGFAVEALKQIGTQEALAKVCDYLLENRWCYSTTPDSLF